MEAEQVTPDLALRELARRELARRQSAQQPEAQQNMGSILPIASTPDGGWEWNSDAGIVGMVKHALKLPGDVYSGDVQMVDPETGRTSQEAIERSIGAAAVLSPMNPMVRSGDGWMAAGMAPRIKSTSVAPPTSEMLLRAGGKGFDQARAMPVKYRDDVVRAMSQRFSSELYEKGFDAGSAPLTFAVLNSRLNPAEGAAVSVRDVIAARAALKNARMDFKNPTDKQAAEWLLERIDKLLGAGHPKTVAAGTDPADAAIVGTLTKEANANYAAGKRGKFLSGKTDHSVLQAAAVNSGRNIGNRIRSQAVTIHDTPRLSKGFSDKELAALRKVAMGTLMQNRTRDVGNLLGGGGGLGAMLTAGAGAFAGAAAGSPTAGAMAALGLGQGSRAISNALTKKAMSNIDRATRMRSPLYEKMLREAGSKRMSPAKRAALMKLLLIEQTAGD